MACAQLRSLIELNQKQTVDIIHNLLMASAETVSTGYVLADHIDIQHIKQLGAQLIDLLNEAEDLETMQKIV